MNFGTIGDANLKLIGDPDAGVMDVMALRVKEGEYYATSVAVFPTPEEMLRLLDGQPVIVTILGNSFPPLRVEVQS